MLPANDRLAPSKDACQKWLAASRASFYPGSMRRTAWITEDARRRSNVISLLALAAIPLILLLLGSLLSGEFGRSMTLRAAVDRSYETRFEIQHLLSLHQDVETGQRGYVMTGDPAFLQPFDSARG